MSIFKDIELYALWTQMPGTTYNPSNLIDVVGWYPNYRTYGANYQASDVIGISNGQNGLYKLKVAYAFNQVGNCYQTPENAWSAYENGGVESNSANCPASAYATGEASTTIYSTDPYSDFLYVPQTVGSWTYGEATQGGRNNFGKIANSLNTVVALGGFGGASAQLLQIIKFGTTDTIKDYLTGFLPAALGATFSWGAGGTFNLPSTATRISNVGELTFDIEPPGNDWTQVSEDFINNLGGFLADAANLKTTSVAGGNVIDTLSITIGANPNVPLTIAGVQNNERCVLTWDDNGVTRLNNLGALVNAVDKIYLMTYDYHGLWDSPAYVNCHSALYCDPAQPRMTGAGNFNIHSTVKQWLDCGVSASKLYIGAASYGRSYASDNPIPLYGEFNTGYQTPYGGAAPLYNNQNLNTDNVKDIKTLLTIDTLTANYNTVSKCAYINGTTPDDKYFFTSYDSVQSLEEKSCYAHCQGLGGIMLWDLGGDVSNVLINTLLTPPTGSCSCTEISGMISASESCTLQFADA